MSKQVFNPLEALGNKPEVTDMQVVNIRFPGARKIIEETMDVGEPAPVKPTVKIVNKRRGPEYREQIMERLLKNKDLPFVKYAPELRKDTQPIINIEEPITLEPEPIKKVKRLIIRDATIKMPQEKEIQKEEAQREEVEEKEELEDFEKEIDKRISEIEPEEEPILEEKEVVAEVVEPVKKKRGRKPKILKEMEEQAKMVEKEDIGKKDEIAEIMEKGKRGRKPAKKEIEQKVDLTTAVIRTQKVIDRLPTKKERLVIPTSNFYMNNRRLFIQKINDLFKNYRQEIMSTTNEITCDSLSGDQSFELLTHQKIARDYLSLYTPYRGLLLYLGLGAGKCHKRDTPIMMHDGSIKMVQDILEGELLMGDDSTPRTVTSLARGKGKMYEVCPVKGEKYIVNDEHILCLKTDNNSNVIEISIKDYLNLTNEERFKLKGYRVPIEFSEKVLPDEPYKVGYYLKDKENANIPMIYKCNSIENRLNLLAGIIDSVAYVNNSGFNITLKDEILINDIIYLVRSLGLSCNKEYSNNDKSFQIFIYGKGIEKIPTKILKYDNFEIHDVDNLLYGITVNYVGEDDYYGFTLDNNCRYVMGDFTVTHNTCTSIAVAEGMKSNKKIVVLTPASLKMNFFTELKKCGDELYRRNQYWEFISIDGNPNYVGILSTALSLPPEYIRKNNGAWLVNINKEPNYSELTPEEQKSLDAQLDEMIRSKYLDLNYNGLNMKRLNALTDNLTRNLFDDSVVIIDEAHNFVSRIVNKIKKPKSIPYLLYNYLLSAKNARVVLLTGTPMINYPNEVGILYNILRGYIKTWSFPINVKTSEKVNTEVILDLFDKKNFRTYDYVDYADNVLTITRNPFGFINMKKRGAVKGTVRVPRPKVGGRKINKKTRKNNVIKPKLNLNMNEKNDKWLKEKKEENNAEDDDETETEHNVRVPQDLYEGGAKEFSDKYDGVHLNEQGNISDEEFQNQVIRILREYGLEVQIGSIKVTNNKALPDDPDQFFSTFINQDTAEFQRTDLFQSRILGLTSYYRSAQESLLPSFVKTNDGDNYHIERVAMSQHQFGVYEKIRKVEADRERNMKKMKRMQKDNAQDLYNISSTYRIFSRAACNFAFPSSIERPHPGGSDEVEIDENAFDNVSKEQIQEVDAFSSIDDEEEKAAPEEDAKYENRIKKALDDIAILKQGTNESMYLSKTSLPEYSPKFAKILENLQNPENEGLHLLYSHFRTIEGIGLLKLILEANGFAEFKIKKNGDIWEWVEDEKDIGKPNFVLYTGTETPEEKEIKRNIYNSSWDVVSINISEKLKERAENNVFGEIIKIFMITSSGAEGINLKNTRFVHIVEPYWHMVRIDQVVGRARRICSHQDLPQDMQNVKVYLYVTMFSEQQKTDEKNIELRVRDVSRIDKKTPVTTDETLYEIASMKQKTNNQILKAMKESAIDCQLYASTRKKGSDDDNLVCYGFGKVESNQFSSYPTFEKDLITKKGLDVQRIQWKARKITQNGIDYALNEQTMEVYDYDSYLKATEVGSNLILIGKLVKKGTKYVIEPIG